MQSFNARVRATVLASFVVTLVCVSFCTASAQADLITITTGDHQLLARQFDPPSANTLFSQTTFPSTRNELALQGGSSSEMTLDWSQSATTANLRFNTSLATDTRAGSNAQARVNSLIFTPSVDAFYSITGTMAFTNPAAGRNFTFNFTNLTTATQLLNGNYAVLGGDITVNVGDPGAIIVGSPNGTLIAGHQYEFEYSNTVSTSNSFNATQDAFASGFAQLQITTIPEPGSLVLLALSAPLLMRRKQTA